MADFVPPAPNSASPFADMRGHHVAVRTPDLETANRWYVDRLDFRVVAEWDYGDQKLAYIAPPTDDHFYVEIFGGGDPRDVRPYSDLAGSLKYLAFHLWNQGRPEESLAALTEVVENALLSLSLNL